MRAILTHSQGGVLVRYAASFVSYRLGNVRPAPLPRRCSRTARLQLQGVNTSCSRIDHNFRLFILVFYLSDEGGKKMTLKDTGNQITLENVAEGCNILSMHAYF